MKKILIALVATFSLVMPQASAASEWPLPTEPTWWKTSGIEGVRYGGRLPCDAAWNSTNDCIESVTLSKVDGSLAGKATFQKNASFDPQTARQIWTTYTGTDGKQLDNNTNFETNYGAWVMPDGFLNSDGSDRVYVFVHLMQGSLHTDVTAMGNSNVRPSLPKDTYFEVGFRSKNMKKYIGWVMASVKDPQVRFDGEVIYVKGVAAPSPWVDGMNPKVCDSNTEKAFSTASAISIMLFTNTTRGNAVAEPGDLVLGTNGWWCINGVYFDQAQQELVTKVGTAHFDEFGKAIEGWLELKVKGNRAKQWWGMEPSIAVGFAKVAISYEDGTSSVATVIANYDKANDWISLKAYGFHFSSPVVKMKFEKAAEPTSSASPTPTTAKVAKPITCVKGKSVKKVNSVTQKCPNGYKKKA